MSSITCCSLESSFDCDVIDVRVRSNVESHLPMKSGVVEEIKLDILNKIVGWISEEDKQNCNVNNRGGLSENK